MRTVIDRPALILYLVGRLLVLAPGLAHAQAPGVPAQTRALAAQTRALPAPARQVPDSASPAPTAPGAAASARPAAPARDAALDGRDAQTHWETQSVRELLQRDLHEALRAPAAASAAGPHSGAAAQPVLAPRLVALYGVGRALMAEVQVAGQAYLYVRGQAWPAGHAGDRGVYQLRGMNGACIQLERGEDRHSLCLRMLLGEARP